MSAGSVRDNCKVEIIRIVVKIQMSPGICTIGGLYLQVRLNPGTANEKNCQSNNEQIVQKSHNVGPWKDKA